MDRIYNNNNRFTALCPGLPGWAGTRRNTHSPTHHSDHHPVFISFFHLPWSILPVQITCLAIFLHNLCPCPLWSTSWSGVLHLIFYTFLHPVSVFFSQHMPILSQPFLLFLDMICAVLKLVFWWLCTVSQMELTAFTQQSVSSWRLSLSLCVREEHHSMLVTLVMNLPSGKHYRLVLTKSPMFWWVFLLLLLLLLLLLYY